MGQFIKLLGGRKYKITNSRKSGLTIVMIRKNPRKVFVREFENWNHLFIDFDKL